MENTITVEQQEPYARKEWYNIPLPKVQQLVSSAPKCSHPVAKRGDDTQSFYCNYLRCCCHQNQDGLHFWWNSKISHFWYVFYVVFATKYWLKRFTMFLLKMYPASQLFLEFFVRACMCDVWLLASAFVSVLVWQVQKEVHMQWLRWQERSYGVVSPAAKGSQMDTPFWHLPVGPSWVASVHIVFNELYSTRNDSHCSCIRGLSVSVISNCDRLATGVEEGNNPFHSRVILTSLDILHTYPTWQLVTILICMRKVSFLDLLGGINCQTNEL